MTSTTLPFSNAKSVAAPGGSFGVTPARTGSPAASSFSGGNPAGQTGGVRAPKAEFNRELSRRTESQAKREVTENRRTQQAEGRSRVDGTKRDEKVSAERTDARAERARDARESATESQGRVDGSAKSGRVERAKGRSESEASRDVQEVSGKTEDVGGGAVAVEADDSTQVAADSQGEGESVAGEEGVEGGADERAEPVGGESQVQVLTVGQEQVAEKVDFAAVLAGGVADVGAEQVMGAEQAGVTVVPGPAVQVATVEGEETGSEDVAGGEGATAGVKVGEWLQAGEAEDAGTSTGEAEGTEAGKYGRLGEKGGVDADRRESDADQDESMEGGGGQGGEHGGRHEAVKPVGVGAGSVAGQQAAVAAATSVTVAAGQSDLADATFSRSAASALDRLTAMHSLTSPQQSTPASTTGAGVSEATPAYTPSDRFLTANTPSIVSGVRSQLLPGGGTLTLRLDPPELGALQVAVVMKDGLASVSFSADNAEAAKLITSTLSQLRDTLSAAGLTVDRLSVQQTVKSDSPSNQGNNNSPADARSSGQPFQAQDENARRDQQRRDQFDRMWRKASGDDVNLFA